MNPEPGEPPAGTANKDHVSGLDAIRGLCAIWVVFSHLGFFPELTAHFDPQSVAGKAARLVMGNLFSGTPAVMVFFVVSGFCIHYPHCGVQTAPGAAFLARRLIRIGVPFGCAFLLLKATVPASQGLKFVQWSLFAELFYYLLYPLLFRLRQVAGWNVWIGLSVLLALAVMASDPAARYMWRFGTGLTWVVGLPHWLMGCRLAEMVRGGRAGGTVSASKIWTLRLSVWAVASAASIMQFHLGVGYPWTMLAFTPLAAEWVRREIQWQAVRPSLRLLTWLGGWSYSIYLLHLSAPDLLSDWGLPVGSNRGTLVWACFLAGALTICLVFHLAVEKPSHQLARWVGRWLAEGTARAQSAK